MNIMLPDELKDYSMVTMWASFPYKDCYFLQASLKRNDGLIPELSYYFSSLAGLASWGTKLFQRSLWQLRRDLIYVRKDSTSHCRNLSRYMYLITDVNTPELAKCIEAADAIRRELIVHLEAIVRSKELALRISKGRKK